MRILAFALLAFLVAGCPQKCVSEAPCTCTNGNAGTLSCDASGATGACKCLNVGGGTGGGSQGGGGGVIGGGGGGGGSVDAGPSVTLTEFCANITRVLCEHRIACGQYDDAGFTLCSEREAGQVSDLCRRAAAGSVQFDGFADADSAPSEARASSVKHPTSVALRPARPALSVMNAAAGRNVCHCDSGGRAAARASASSTWCA